MDQQKKSFLPDDGEQIIQIEIERLKTFKNHPFKVQDDEEMKLLKESIEKYGILNPLIVRPLKEGVYEIISGHRRRLAAEQLGYRKVPVIIRVMRDEESSEIGGSVISPADTWNCTCGCQGIKSKFCPDCGSPKPVPVVGWDCPECGNKDIIAKFCPECGHKREG